MARDYFKHKLNTRNDPKLIKVQLKLGNAGRLLYWDLIEIHYEQNSKLNICDIPLYAYQLRVDETLIREIISKEYNLFESDKNYFWSPSAYKAINELNETIDKLKNAGKKSGKTRREKAENKPEIIDEILDKPLDLPSNENEPTFEPELNLPSIKIEPTPEQLDYINYINKINKTNNITLDNINDVNFMFEVFWNLYDKKISKDKCCAKFKKLSKKDMTKIFETLPEYIEVTKDNKKFRKQPETYLNNKSWNDEIINYNNATTNGNGKQHYTAESVNKSDYLNSAKEAELLGIKVYGN